MSCNMRMIVEGGHNWACNYCQRVVPLAGHLTGEMREFTCVASRPHAQHEHRHIINQPCTGADWAICPLNEHKG